MSMHGFRADNVYERLSLAGDDYADKDAAASFLEETKKVLLSQLMLKSSASSNAAKEMEALADPQYSVHIARMVDARKEANMAKSRWLSAQAWCDAKRTEAATERAAMKQS